LTSGVLGALLHLFFADGNSCLVGASGAIYGLFGAVAVLRPNLQMVLIIFPFFPIKVKYLFPMIMLFDFCMAIFSETSKIGHWCHVGGGVVGVFMALACADFASRSYGDEDE
jgi:membrane associated rhomboid family serine protease